MLSQIRKFSGSIYAKILLGIVVIPFIFWGMGDFSSGNKNVIVKVDNEKYTIQEFTKFIEINLKGQKISNAQIENMLSNFIAEKLMKKEIDYFKIKLSDNSLSKLIKHQKEFKRGDNFSRVEYEKFLLESNITASSFEKRFKNHEKRRHLLNLIGGGIQPAKFLVNAEYNKINQKRSVQLINLDNIYDKKINFTEDQIKSFFENNKKKYNETYKSFRIVELNPINLTQNDNYSDLFFKKIDEIDDMIIQGDNLELIKQKYNLDKIIVFTVDRFGKSINSEKIVYLEENIIKDIYKINESEPTKLLENKDKYFIIELDKIENIQKNISNEAVKKDILFTLKSNTKRKLISELVSKINLNKFTKIDFDNFYKKEKIQVKKIKLDNQNDNKKLRQDLINQIYGYSPGKVIVVHSLDFSENYLIYIDKVENVSVSNNTDEYNKYLNLSEIKIKNELYNTYDIYLKQKYEIDINYQALDAVKSYFN